MIPKKPIVTVTSHFSSKEGSPGQALVSTARTTERTPSIPHSFTPERYALHTITPTTRSVTSVMTKGPMCPDCKHVL